MTKNSPFHLVTNSPWPLIMSFNIFMTFISFILWMYFLNVYYLFLFMNLSIISSFMWWQNISWESTYQGSHTNYVKLGLKFGMILFIISEMMFFISIFWSFFHMSISPNIEIGSQWPPLNIKKFNPFSLPLMNTIILLSSGMSLTYSHYSMINNKFKKTSNSLIITITLGIIFTLCQIFEYQNSQFSTNDSAYGSIFFFSTGFHGIHVMIGTLFLISCWIKLNFSHYTKNNHLSFEMASWYWHFVDIIWLFLFLFIY